MKNKFFVSLLIGYKILCVNVEYFFTRFSTCDEFVSPKTRTRERINAKIRAKWLTFYGYFENNEKNLFPRFQSIPSLLDIQYLPCKYFPRDRQLSAIANIVVYIHRIQVFSGKKRCLHILGILNNRSLFRSFSLFLRVFYFLVSFHR